MFISFLPSSPKKHKFNRLCPLELHPQANGALTALTIISPWFLKYYAKATQWINKYLHIINYMIFRKIKLNFTLLDDVQKR